MLNISWFVTLVNLFFVNLRAGEDFGDTNILWLLVKLSVYIFSNGTVWFRHLTFLRLFTRLHSKQADPALYPLSSEKCASIRAPCRGSLFTPKPLPRDAGAGALGADRVQKSATVKFATSANCTRVMLFTDVLWTKKQWEVIVTVKASGPPNWFGLFIVLNFFSSLFRQITEGFSRCVWRASGTNKPKYSSFKVK